MSGRIQISSGATIGDHAVLHISLLDVTEIDRAATVVTQIRIAAPQWKKARGAAAFELDATVDPQRRYVVSAHADMDGDGAVSAGDYLTTQSYPVATFGYPCEVDLVLRPC